MNSFIWQGYKVPLEQETLYDLAPNNSASYLSEKFEKRWNEIKMANPSAPVNVSPLLFGLFGKQYIRFGLLHLIQAATNIASPVVIGLITSFVQTSASNQAPPVWMGFVWCVVFFVLQVSSTFALNKYFHNSMRCAMRVKACLTTACYRKMMKVRIYTNITTSKYHHMA